MERHFLEIVSSLMKYFSHIQTSFISFIFNLWPTKVSSLIFRHRRLSLFSHYYFRISNFFVSKKQNLEDKREKWKTRFVLKKKRNMLEKEKRWRQRPWVCLIIHIMLQWEKRIKFFGMKNFFVVCMSVKWHFPTMKGLVCFTIVPCWFFSPSHFPKNLRV